MLVMMLMFDDEFLGFLWNLMKMCWRSWRRGNEGRRWFFFLFV